MRCNQTEVIQQVDARVMGFWRKLLNRLRKSAIESRNNNSDDDNNNSKEKRINDDKGCCGTEVPETSSHVLVTGGDVPHPNSETSDSTNGVPRLESQNDL